MMKLKEENVWLYLLDVCAHPRFSDVFHLDFHNSNVDVFPHLHEKSSNQAQLVLVHSSSTSPSKTNPSFFLSIIIFRYLDRAIVLVNIVVSLHSKFSQISKVSEREKNTLNSHKNMRNSFENPKCLLLVNPF